MKNTKTPDIKYCHAEVVNTEKEFKYRLVYEDPFRPLRRGDWVNAILNYNKPASLTIDGVTFAFFSAYWENIVPTELPIELTNEILMKLFYRL